MKIFVKPWLSNLLLCAHNMWHVLLRESVTGSQASECTSGPLLLPIIPQLHRSTKSGTNGISYPSAIAPYQARDCKSQQKPCYEGLCAHSLWVPPLRLCRQWGFFASEKGETVCELSWDIAGSDGH